MKQVLHIIFNEDVFGDNLGEKFSDRLDNIQLPYLQVKDLKQYKLLIGALPGEMKVCTWVHPNNSLKKAKGLDTTNQEDIAFSLKRYPAIRFNLVTRIPSPPTNALANQLEVGSKKINEMWDVKPEFAQSVAELKQALEITGHPGTATDNTFTPLQKEQYDYAIISALFSDEFESLMDFLDLTAGTPLHINSIREYSIKGTDKKVIAAFQPQMGMVDAASIATAILSHYEVNHLFMNGVCGGRKEKNIELMDIIIPDKVFDYQTGKLKGGIFYPYLRSSSVDVSHVLMQKERVHQAMITMAPQPLKDVVRKCHIRFGSMACGNKVVKTDNMFTKDIATIDEQSIAVDMESYGIIRACELLGNRCKPIIIKSVMDFTTEQKNDDVKKEAAYMSSLFTIALIKDFL